MRRNKKRLFFDLPLLIIAVTFLLGFVVMLLWNFVFPVVLHAEKITYWQALALLVLCRILFFGFRKGYHRRPPDMWRGGQPWRQKWMNMSDEERSKFREEWRRRCGRPEQKD